MVVMVVAVVVVVAMAMRYTNSIWWRLVGMLLELKGLGRANTAERCRTEGCSFRVAMAVRMVIFVSVVVAVAIMMRL